MELISRENLLICIMSYERGLYLKNCVRSVEKNFKDYKIHVFDDGSTGKNTRDILDQISLTHKVTRSSKNDDSVYLGGLHANMNKALDVANDGGFIYILFLQDDQQVIRNFVDQDRRELTRIFDHSEGICQVQPLFFKDFYGQDYLRGRYTAIAGLRAYKEREAVNGISDIGFTSIDRLKSANFQFSQSETQSAVEATTKGLRLVTYGDPLAMYTPWPETFRSGGRLGKLLMGMNDWGVNAGCHPFKEIKSDKLNQLLKRSIDVFPECEKYLETSARLQEPWWYSNAYDYRKITDLKQILLFRWIFDGPIEYQNFKKSRKL